ncbi:MAG: hypothetical protein ACYCX7_00975 [Solirubrobacteraceae bacterium]
MARENGTSDNAGGAANRIDLGASPSTPQLTRLDRGIVAGILIGEGHFGGDGRYPQITLRMHTRHEALFRWLHTRFPRTRLYGPYTHGGRSYYQWMARGDALVEEVLPVVESVLSDDLDAHVAGRVREMRARYAAFFDRHER